LVTAVLLSSAIGSIVSGGAKASASVIGGTATVGAAAAPATMDASRNAQSANSGYFVDSLFRKDASANGAPALAGDDATRSTAEVSRIFAASLSNGSMSSDDTKYVGQLVAQRTGLAPADAEKRVTDTFNKAQAKAKDVEAAAKDAADKARKASAYAALWLFVSLLVGAFVASFAATFGGRRRDLF
jgi:hypothetical protein